jgi:hypothetical protein
MTSYHNRGCSWFLTSLLCHIAEKQFASEWYKVFCLVVMVSTVIFFLGILYRALQFLIIYEFEFCSCMNKFSFYRLLCFGWTNLKVLGFLNPPFFVQIYTHLFECQSWITGCIQSPLYVL